MCVCVCVCVCARARVCVCVCVCVHYEHFFFFKSGATRSFRYLCPAPRIDLHFLSKSGAVAVLSYSLDNTTVSCTVDISALDRN